MRLHLVQIVVLITIIEAISSAPSDLISFNNGNVGVDFLGFKASAGLGGLLTGNAAGGGLHAEAGTPYGQAAGAGLGGSLLKGASVGGLYADATAGGGVEAAAGLADQSSFEGSFGNTYAGAAAGTVTGVTKEKTIIGQKGISGAFKSKTVINHPVAAIDVHKEVISQPAVAVEFHKEVIVPEVQKHVQIVEEVKPQKTYIERTVIPNYEEKTIYVPSYVEKTIRVPTVVEKKVKVPAAPTVIEKTVSAPSSTVNVDAGVHAEVVPTQTYVYQKTKLRTRPHFRKHFYYNGGYEGSSEAGAAGGVAGSTALTVRKTFNTHLIDDIFNIPISTLGAVNKLVGGLAGGAGGSFEISKSAAFSKY